VTSVRPPDVVVVIADDAGWGDFGCYGATAVPTPNIDALAAAGVRLTDCHSSGAVCTPSRYSLLTGRYSWRGPLKSFVLMGHGPPLIEPHRPTLASVLRCAGYDTGAFGKWHLGLGWRHRDGTVRDAFDPGESLHDDIETDSGADIDYDQPFTGGPTALGFDRYFGIAGSIDMPPYCFLDQDRTSCVPTAPKQAFFGEQRPGLQCPDWVEEEVDVRFVEEAVRWIDARPADRPLLAYLALSAPHRPCLPPAFVRGRSRAGARGDEICLMDWAVGELVAVLERTGRRENTLLIVTSDHGAVESLTDDTGPAPHRPNGPWRGQKGDVWEGGHRVPFVASWPARLPPGLVRDDPVGTFDVLPTAAAAAGLRLPSGAAEDGRNILAVLTGEAAPDRDRPLVHHSLGGRFALRVGRWKAIFAAGPGGGLSEPGIEQLWSSGTGKPIATPAWDAAHPDGQLYDMVADPGEQVNLWHSRPMVAAAMYEQLKQVCRSPHSGLPFDVPLDVGVRSGG
jgi:arylsulfatase A-like enzyme